MAPQDPATDPAEREELAGAKTDSSSKSINNNNNNLTDKLTGSVQLAPNEQLIRASQSHHSQITLNSSSQATSSSELSSCCDAGSASKFR